MPLNNIALEKIIRAKLNKLTQHLEFNFGIELNYSTDIIKFLTHLAFDKHENTQAIEKLFEQQVYASIAHEMVARLEDKNRLKRLTLQLNESGHALRCEAVVASENAML